MKERKNPHAVALGRRGGAKRADDPNRVQLARNAGLAAIKVARRSPTGQFLPRLSDVSTNETVVSNNEQSAETDKVASVDNDNGRIGVSSSETKAKAQPA